MPNAARRLHWRKRAGQARNYRHQCWAEAIEQAANSYQVTSALAVDVQFCRPDRRKRDLDNLLAALKPGLDGVAQAMGVDDSAFASITVSMGAVMPRGGVFLRIRPAPQRATDR